MFLGENPSYCLVSKCVVDYLVSYLMNFLIWNIRGCGSHKSFLHVKDLVHAHHINFFGECWPFEG